MTSYILFVFAGVFIGAAASLTGLGGGFLVVPVLMMLGYSAQKAVGTSFAAIFVIAISALFSHQRFDNIDWRTGLALGAGGIVGAQLGPHLLALMTTGQFKKLFALILLGLAVYLWLQK